MQLYCNVCADAERRRNRREVLLKSDMLRKGFPTLVTGNEGKGMHTQVIPKQLLGFPYKVMQHDLKTRRLNERATTVQRSFASSGQPAKGIDFQPSGWLKI